MALVLKDRNRKLKLSGQSPTGECAYGTNLKRLRKKSWRTANTTTAAEAELILKSLRGAEAPLFHVAHAFVNFSATSEVVPFPIFYLPRRMPQLADDCGDVVFLEEADGGDAGCAGFEAGVGILQSYSA